jgi:glyoxylase I family protein
MKYGVHHVALSVSNPAASIAFYQRFGFDLAHRLDDEHKSIYQLKLDNFVLELFAYKQNLGAQQLELEYANNLTEVGVKHLALQTDNAAQSLQELKAADLADESTNIDDSEPGLEYFFVKDPDGMWVEIIHDTRY